MMPVASSSSYLLRLPRGISMTASTQVSAAMHFPITEGLAESGARVSGIPSFEMGEWPTARGRSTWAPDGRPIRRYDDVIPQPGMGGDPEALALSESRLPNRCDLA